MKIASLSYSFQELEASSILKEQSKMEYNSRLIYPKSLAYLVSLKRYISYIEKIHSEPHPRAPFSPCALFFAALKADWAFRNAPRAPRSKFQTHHLTWDLGTLSYIYPPISENLAVFLRYYV